ncbi:carbohydrate kinase family protein [uncultured Arcanobacterium sp.]|uniref:carbohydrate kinase family protein n=1 Tax=uncultured Arcanobacterium sp. TaxID=487520 RepID=UPI002607662F|nr:PfkB family carbohydrate kinase [uncultured Arcanobacterium sp.]
MTFLVIGEDPPQLFTAAAWEKSAPLTGGTSLNIATGLARLGRAVSLLLPALENTELNTQIIQYCQENAIKIYNPSTARADIPTAAPLLVHIESSKANSYCEDAPASSKNISTPSAEWIKLYHPYATISYNLNLPADAEKNSTQLRAQFESYLPFIDVLKAQAKDLAILYQENNLEKVAQQILAKGVSLALISQHESGLQLYTSRHQITIPSAEVRIADSSGAEDSLMAAFIDGLARLSVLGREEINGIRNLSKAALVSLGSYGATAAGISLSQYGEHLPTRKEISAKSEDYSVGAL